MPTRRSIKAADGERSPGSEDRADFPSSTPTRCSRRMKPIRSEESCLPSARGQHAQSKSPEDVESPNSGTVNAAGIAGGRARQPHPSSRSTHNHAISSVANKRVPETCAVGVAVTASGKACKPIAASPEATNTKGPPRAFGAISIDEHAPSEVQTASLGPVDSQLAPAELSADGAVKSEDAAKDSEERQRGPSPTSVEETAAIPGCSQGGHGSPRTKKQKSSRKSISSAHALHQRPPRTSSDWTQKLPLDMTCVLLAAVGITLLLVIWLVTVNQHPEVDFGTRERYCHTEECLRHAQLISTSLNDSVDPCEDFNAFVCSRLKPPCQCCEDSSYGSALATRALHGWFSDFREFLDAGKDHLRAGAKALAMFDACMAPTDKEDAEAGKLMLRDVMTKLRIPWPDEPEPGVDPLGVLVMLTYRWHLDFWFNLTPRLMAAGVFETGSRTLMVRPGGFVAFWSVHDKEILRENGYVAYWNSFYEEFAADRPKRGKAYIEDVARVEQDVFDKLTRVINNENKEPAQFLLADIEIYSPSLPTDRWVKALRAAQTASDTMSFGHEPGDRFVVTDVALLKALDSLFTTHSNVDLLRHLSWFFIQVFAALADRSLLKIKYLDHRHSAELHKHEFCATEVEDAYGPLVPVVYVYPRFTAAMRRSIDALFLELTQTAAEMASSLAWADGASRQVAMSKLLKVDTVLWPPESLLSNDTLSMLYANFSSTKGFSSKRRLFIEYWIDAQQNLRALHENIAYRDVLVLPHNYVLPHMKYDYLQNWVVISVAALQGPLKAADSTPAMLYGGIGFLYARQMLRALDCGGLRIDAQGNVVPQSWASPQWKAASRNRTECLQPVHEGPFPEIPALEVAYEAFQRKLQKGGDVPRRIMKKYDEQQVFFITACFTLCRLPNTLKSHGGDCNKAAMNFEPFAKAFKCKPDSAMNPSKKCPYFN